MSYLWELSLHPSDIFRQFAEELLVTTQVSPSVVFLSLLYVHRMREKNSIIGAPRSMPVVVSTVVSILIASKILDDNTYTAKTWSEVACIDLKSIIAGEAEFLKALDFRLHVSGQEFEDWIEVLEGFVATRQSQLSRRQSADTPPLSAISSYPPPFNHYPLHARPLSLPKRENFSNQGFHPLSSPSQSSPSFGYAHNQLHLSTPPLYNRVEVSMVPHSAPFSSTAVFDPLLPFPIISIPHQTSSHPSTKRSFETAIPEGYYPCSSRSSSVNKRLVRDWNAATLQLPSAPIPIPTFQPTSTPEAATTEFESSLLEKFSFRANPDLTSTNSDVPYSVSGTTWKRRFSPILTYGPPSTSRPENLSFYFPSAGKRRRVVCQTSNQISPQSYTSAPHNNTKLVPNTFQIRNLSQPSAPSLSLSSSRKYSSNLSLSSSRDRKSVV